MKAASAALLSAVLGLLIKRHNPEGALLLGAICALGILTASLGILDGFSSLRKLFRQSFGGEAEGLLSPVLKCLAISIVSRFSAESQTLDPRTPILLEPTLAKISPLSVEANSFGTICPSTGTLITWAPLRISRTRAWRLTPLLA